MFIGNLISAKRSIDSTQETRRWAVSRRGLVSLFLFFLVFLGSATPHRALGQDQEVERHIDANDLAREVVQNEINAQDKDDSLWAYREVHEENGKIELRAVVQTKDGEIHRLLSVDGEPLTPKQQEMEDERIQKLLAHPNEFRAKQKNEEHDADQGRKLMEMLPDAFRYEYDGTMQDLIKLTFKPNPNFHPTSHESEVFHHMEGVMLLDRRQKRLAEIDGRLVTDVRFWDGLLGHLDRGGTFSVKQEDLGSGHWEMTLLDVRMAGKALFFKTIAVQEREVHSDFRPIPANTTLQQAAQLLNDSK
jgi:hypothetical protein